MKCADPVLCYTMENGNRILRNFTFVKDSLLLPYFRPLADCGKCLICRKRKSYELACRCVLHSSLYLKNCFLTLTYDEKKPEYHNNFNYRDIQLFKKSLREHVRRTYGKRIEIFNVHEYGKNGKKHWHLVVFNHDFDDKELFTIKNGNRLYISATLSRYWEHGHHTIGEVSEASAMYQAQYMEKDFQHNHAGTAKKSHSKHSGIGRAYFLKHYSQILRLGYIPIAGKKLPVPRYFQKLAHKHYCHFYEQTAFLDYPKRKALYRPFKQNEANKEIAELYIQFKAIKEERTLELEKQWQEVISQYLTTDETPDFIKAAANKMYDLQRKTGQEQF